MSDQVHRVLFVCLGNICRSPTAEGVLRHRAAQLAPAWRVEIDSAGTANYHVGSAPDRRSQRAALRRGIDISGLRARQVTTEDFNHFDLILAMDTTNLRDLEALRPASSTAQLGLFLEYRHADGIRDVPDPYYGDEQAFERVLDLTSAAADGLIRDLAPQLAAP